MKQIKRIFKVFVFVIMLSLVTPAAMPISNTIVAQAATVKLNKTTLSLEVGKTYTLKIVPTTKSKITWTTSSKTVATVSSKGKVTAKKAGKATITATVNKKKYTCKVTVKEKVNPYVKNAPYDAKLATYGKLNCVIPKDWTSNILSEVDNSFIVSLYPDAADLITGTSNVAVIIQETGVDKPDYSSAKPILEESITEELVLEQFQMMGIEATVYDFTVSDYESKLGTAYKVDYTVNSVGKTFKQTVYTTFIDNFMISVTITDVDDSVTPDVNEVGEYIFNSVHTK